MKTKQLLTTVFFAVTLMQIPVASYALNIKVRNASENEGALRSPGKNNKPVIPITYYNEAAKIFSIASRADSISTLVIDEDVVSDQADDLGRYFIMKKGSYRYNPSIGQNGGYHINMERTK